MSLVISQTHPYSPTDLQLSDNKRWIRLLPLSRPSVEEVKTSSGHTILIDKALINSKEVLIAAVGLVSSLSGKILSESHLAAVETELKESKDAPLSASDLLDLLKNNGFPIENGTVIVRLGQRPEFKIFDGGFEVHVVGALRLDHCLKLLSAALAETRASIEKTKALLEHFTELSVETSSAYLEEKLGSSPSVSHATEISEFNTAKQAIGKDMDHLLDLASKLEGNFVYSVHFSDINGLSKLENNILGHEITTYLAMHELPSYITHSTIVDLESPARGWAISLCPIPIEFLSARPTPTNTLANTTLTTPPLKRQNLTSHIHFSDSHIRKIITAGCESVINDEPTITEYDTIVGDGDCGYTLRDGAKQVLTFIASTDLSDFPSALSSMVDDLEVNMGGTSGALYCIFLSSLSQELWTASTFPDALKGALEHLLKYTKARLGDRTCLDCLIPFVETLKRTGDMEKGLEEAGKGVESTKMLEAKLGRSSYLDEEATKGVPDPGAYGLLKLLEGLIGAK